MDTHAQHLFAEALKLPVDTREDLAIRLMGSVAPAGAQDDAIRQAWTAEIDRRVARFEKGETTAIPVEDVWPALAGKPWRATPADNG